MLSGTRLEVVASRLFQVRTESRPSIGGIAAPLPVATTTARRAISASSPTTTCRSPSSRPSPRNSSMPRSSSQGSWPESSRSWITSSRRSRTACGSRPARGGDSGHPARLRQQLAGAQQRLRRHAGVVGAFAADQVALDDRHREPAFGEAPRADLARRAGADHDRVEFSLAHLVIATRHRTIDADIARGRQASIWSIRANGCRSRLPEASLNPGTNQYVRTMSSPSLPS